MLHKGQTRKSAIGVRASLAEERHEIRHLKAHLFAIRNRQLN
jgi:hypothetical protein